MQITVQEVMTRGPIAVHIDATIDQVLDTLVSEGVGAIYVTTDENRLAGIVTDYEVLKHQVLGDDRRQTAETLMSRQVPTIGPQEDAVALCPQFRDGRLARMAVIDEQGRLIGNLSRRDMMRMMRNVDELDRNMREAAPRTVPPPRGVQLSRKALSGVGAQ